MWFYFCLRPTISSLCFSFLPVPSDGSVFGVLHGCNLLRRLETLTWVCPDIPTSFSKHLFLSYQVCELDIIFNFEKAYFILDEFIMGGEIQETSKKSAVKAIEDSDMLQEVSTQCWYHGGGWQW